jgi:hypothetical protein
MRILPWIFRILLILMLLRLVLRWLFPPRRPLQDGAKARRPERLGGELVRDPNCGTYIPREKALAAGSGASATYFCSAACRDAYAAAQPARSR